MVHRNIFGSEDETDQKNDGLYLPKIGKFRVVELRKTAEFAYAKAAKNGELTCKMPNAALNQPLRYYTISNHGHQQQQHHHHHHHSYNN
jgi:hypothetical protein